MRNAGRFSINDQYRFLDVLTLFAALLLEKIPIIEYLVGKTPYFQLKEKEVPEEKYTFILPEFADTEVLIDILELVDSAFIFHGRVKTREDDFTCWNNEAIKLLFPKDDKPFPKLNRQQSQLGMLFLKNKNEFQNVASWTNY